MKAEVKFLNKCIYLASSTENSEMDVKRRNESPWIQSTLQWQPGLHCTSQDHEEGS